MYYLFCLSLMKSDLPVSSSSNNNNNDHEVTVVGKGFAAFIKVVC